MAIIEGRRYNIEFENNYTTQAFHFNIQNSSLTNIGFIEILGRFLFK